MEVTKYKWNDCHYKWSSFNLGSSYVNYLNSEYGISTTGQVRWDHVLNVIEVVVDVITGGKAAPVQANGTKKPPKKTKKIKLTFKYEDVTKKIEKDIKVDKKIKIIANDIINKIYEIKNIKLELTNVQIIERKKQ